MHSDMRPLTAVPEAFATYGRTEAIRKLAPHKDRTIRAVYTWASRYILRLDPAFAWPDWDYRTVGEFLNKYGKDGAR